MKIKELRIGHFGKLHNVTIRLEEGVNLIFGENESGKSTVHAFIGAMLFGLEKSRGRASKDDLYTRYQPWEAPAEYRGSMDFEHEGRDYRITRVFYQAEKSCIVTELATGRRIQLADDSITSLIPSLTKTAFYNTVSMGQTTLRCSDDFAGEVRNHIANLATTGGSKVDVPGALAELEAKKKELRKQLNTIDIEALKAREQELLEKEKEALRLSGKKKELLGQAEPLRERIAVLQESIPDTKPLLQERQQAKEKADAALKELLGIERKLRERDDTGIIPEGSDGTDNTYTGDTDTEISPKRMQGAGLILLAVGGLCCIAGNERSAILIGAGIIMLITAIILIFAAYLKKRAGARERQGRTRGLKDAEKKVNGEEPDSLNAGKQEEELSREDLEKERLLAEEKYRSLDAELAGITARLDEAAADRERAGGEILSLDESADELEALADRIEWELENLGDIGDELDICKHELRDASEKATGLEAEIAALEKAAETIGRLSAEIHDSFSEFFNELLSEEVCLATDGRYPSGRVNDDLKIEVMSGIDYVPAESLSTGAMQQLFTALRFATARMFFADTDVPILLDECFAYSDENRLRSALSALSERDGRQILLFTCRKDEREVLDGLGAAYNLIRM